MTSVADPASQVGIAEELFTWLVFGFGKQWHTAIAQNAYST
jgi:hypothetical protein